jgi:hypothetical protein
MPSFEFADCPTRINLTVAADTQTQTGSLACTIRNTTARQQTGRVRIEPIGGARAEWFSLTEATATSPREIEQDFAANGTLTIQVAVKVPPKTPPGNQTFRLRVTSEASPDTDYAEGPAVALEIAPFVEPVTPSKTVVPWWAFAVVGLFIVLVLGAVTWLAWPTAPPPAPLDQKQLLGKPLADAMKTVKDHGIAEVKAQSGDAWGFDPAQRIVVGVADEGRTLFVDDGVKVPDTLRGHTYIEAAGILLDRGVVPNYAMGQVDSRQPVGTVITTQPEPGTAVALGHVITVILAVAAEPPTFVEGHFGLSCSLSRCGAYPPHDIPPAYAVKDLNKALQDRLANKDKMVDIVSATTKPTP